MANVLFDKGREGFLDGSIDWDTNTIKAVLVNSGFSPSSTNSVLTDVTGRAGGDGASAVISPTFGSKTVTDGVADAADITFTAVSSTAGVVNSIVIYQTAGLSSSARVIAFIDSATGLDVTPNGGDITVQWDSGANRIFKL